MSLFSTNQTIQHPQIGDLYWMTVSVNFLIELNMGTVHTVAVHFRYDWYMCRLANEFLCRNPIVITLALCMCFTVHAVSAYNKTCKNCIYTNDNNVEVLFTLYVMRKNCTYCFNCTLTAYLYLSNINDDDDDDGDVVDEYFRYVLLTKWEMFFVLCFLFLYRPIVAGDKQVSEASNGEYVLCFLIYSCWMLTMLSSNYAHLLLEINVCEE